MFWNVLKIKQLLLEQNFKNNAATVIEMRSKQSDATFNSAYLSCVCCETLKLQPASHE